jgi:hypothetical protein
VEGLPWALSRLQGQAWGRYSRGEDWQRAAYAWRAAAALGDEGALRKAEEAEGKAAGGE